MKKASKNCSKCSYHIIEKTNKSLGYKYRLICKLQNNLCIVLSNYPDTIATFGISNTCPFQ